MTDTERYDHERAHDRHPTGVYVAPDRPRVEMAAASLDDMPDHYETDDRDDLRAVRGIALAVALSLALIAAAGLAVYWMLAGGAS